MGKKKKQSTESLLNLIDTDIMSQYRDIREDLDDFQYQLMVADRKDKKKYKKKMKKGKKYKYGNSKAERVMEKRKNSVYSGSMTDDFLDTLNDLRPVITMTGRCTAVLLLAILSMKSVKVNASKNTLKKIDKIFEFGMKL
jgi:hypothetical protein